MTPNELCHSSNPSLLITAALMLLFGGGLSLFLLKRGAPRARVAILFAIFFVVAGGFVIGTLKPDTSFISYGVSDGNLLLGFAFPKSAVTIPIGQVKSLRVAHGVVRQQERGGAVRVSDTVWITLDAGGESYRSCHAAGSERLVAAAKDIAAGVHVTPQWRVHCEDGHELDTSDDDVARGGSRWESDFAPRCAAAK